MWFNDPYPVNKIGRITPTGAVTEFSVPIRNGYSFSSSITTGPDDNLWFTDTGSIGRITPTGAITHFMPLTGMSFANWITAGPDGNLWFTESIVNQVSRITTDGNITSFPTPNSNSGPMGITAGPDGNLWFTESRGNAIGRITPTGEVTEYPVPTPESGLGAITLGPDGNLWFVEYLGRKVGRITPAGAITEFTIPGPGGNLSAITAGPDGNLWYAQAYLYDTASGNTIGGKIGRITLAGVITEFPISNDGGSPQGITVGSDGNLWFTQSALLSSGIGTIGQVVLANIGPPTDVTATMIAGPEPVTLGRPLTYALTVTNRGPSAATGVTLVDTLPSGVNFVSATGGSLPVEGILSFHLGDLPAGATATVTVTVTPATVGTLTHHAAVGADQFELNPEDNAVALTVSVVPPLNAPPVVHAPLVVGVRRYGVHAQPTALVVTFNDSLDPVRAQDADNYQIVRLRGHRRAGLRIGRMIRVRAVVYDPALNAVTLFPAMRLGVRQTYQLTINGGTPTGLTNALGIPLDGDGDGQAGGRFVSPINWGTLFGRDISSPGRPADTRDDSPGRRGRR